MGVVEGLTTPHLKKRDCYETWSPLREEHRLRMIEKKALRKIFGAKRDEITG